MGVVRWWYSDVFIYLNFNNFRGLQKNEYFWGFENFVDIFQESLHNWTSLGLISIHFRVFSNV